VTLPNFLIIGAQKAGTTWLHHNLQLHPQIWMPYSEVHYFDMRIKDTDFSLKSKVFGKSAADQRWRKRVGYSTMVHLKNLSLPGLLWSYKLYARPPSDEWYTSLFEPGREKIVGETTPAYSICGRDAVAHAHRLMPEAKIVFLMRNPIERAWSQAVMRIGNKGKRVENVPGEILIKRFVSQENSLLRTNYLRTLENWGSFYPPHRIFVGFLEDIHFHPEDFLRSVCEFLGVDPSFKSPQVDKKINARSSDTMPTMVASHLARTCQDSIQRLEERFRGYATSWLYCAERLIENPPAEEKIPYPLWESNLWEELPGGSEKVSATDPRGTGFQSGVLTSFGAARRGAL
jgi:hypothetical protein